MDENMTSSEEKDSTNLKDVRLPKAIREAIYKGCCECRLTEEQAQREPCACSAFALIENIEDWRDSFDTNESDQIFKK